MREDTNDMRPFDPGKELNKFRDPLPAEFLSDASEGLNLVKDEKELESVVQHLNRQLHRHLSHKKLHRKRKGVGELSWVYWVIIIILLLTLVAFVVVRMILKH